MSESSFGAVQPILGSRSILPLGGALGRQTQYFPRPMLRDIERYAARVRQSPSWCLDVACAIAAGDLHDGEFDRVATSELLEGQKQAVTVELSMVTWHHITTETERLDRSRSWVLQRAWLIARELLTRALRAEA